MMVGLFGIFRQLYRWTTINSGTRFVATLLNC